MIRMLSDSIIRRRGVALFLLLRASGLILKNIFLSLFAMRSRLRCMRRARQPCSYFDTPWRAHSAALRGLRQIERGTYVALVRPTSDPSPINNTENIFKLLDSAYLKSFENLHIGVPVEKHGASAVRVAALLPRQKNSKGSGHEACVPVCALHGLPRDARQLDAVLSLGAIGRRSTT
jgi:hypothetical protein